MPDVKITCRPNGPLLIDGTVAITDSKGQPVPLDPGKTMVALCRCGHSGTKTTLRRQPQNRQLFGIA